MDEGVVRRIAQLARIRLDERELGRVAAQLGAIVEYFDKLEELDTREVPPLVHPVDRADVLAEDVVRPSLDPEAALANAPRQDGRHFRVPRVLGKAP